VVVADGSDELVVMPSTEKFAAMLAVTG